MRMEKLTNTSLAGASGKTGELAPERSKNWRKEVSDNGLTPIWCEVQMENTNIARERIALRKMLVDYKDEVKKYIQEVIRDGRSFINPQAQFNVYWNYLFLPEGSFDYSQKARQERV